jgi:hypothetical protein
VGTTSRTPATCRLNRFRAGDRARVDLGIDSLVELDDQRRIASVNDSARNHGARRSF